jgi:hypothetical protein
MKKYFIYGLTCLAVSLTFFQCSKENNFSENKEDKPSVESKQQFRSHLVSTSDGEAMIKNYDEQIGVLIEDKFKNLNPNYHSPTTVTYDIDALVSYLNYIKEKGATKVHVRYAAVNGSGVDGQISGLPYHGLLFYGNGFSNNKNSDSLELTGFFNHGELCPPLCKPNGGSN